LQPAVSTGSNGLIFAATWLCALLLGLSSLFCKKKGKTKQNLLPEVLFKILYQIRWLNARRTLHNSASSLFFMRVKFELAASWAHRVPRVPSSHGYLFFPEGNIGLKETLNFFFATKNDRRSCSD
jgi:hypothetical protein